MFAFLLLAGIAMISTLDSGHLALRWHVQHINRVSRHPLAAMLPEGLRTATVPAFAISFGLAWLAFAVGAHLEHFMVLFATVFLVNGLVLVLAAFRPAMVPPSRGVVFLTGALSMSLMMIGYFEDLPLAMIAAIGLPLAMIAPSVLGARTAVPDKRPGEPADTHPGAGGNVPTALGPPMPGPPVGESNLAPVVSTASPDPRPAAAEIQLVEATSGWFDDAWFTIPLIPTYSNTTSVGNVYFADYIAWVGKARELFFRFCMPDFDIRRSDFFILTRSVSHKFIREIREFEAVRIRLKIGGYNRKFVRLEHEIRRTDGSLVGAGEQSLMFVDAKSYGLVDIPGEVYAAFIRYAR